MYHIDFVVFIPYNKHDWPYAFAKLLLIIGKKSR